MNLYSWSVWLYILFSFIFFFSSTGSQPAWYPGHKPLYRICSWLGAKRMVRRILPALAGHDPLDDLVQPQLLQPHTQVTRRILYDRPIHAESTC